MAIHYVAYGTDIQTIQEMLGLASLIFTEIYLSPAKKGQRQAMQGARVVSHAAGPHTLVSRLDPNYPLGDKAPSAITIAAWSCTRR